MNISTISSIYSQINSNQQAKSVNFKSFNQNKALVNNSVQKGEFYMRKFSNKIFDIFSNKKVKAYIDAISKIKPEQSKIYLNQISAIARQLSSEKIIEVNDENDKLKRIIEEGKSNIFIMNHSNQSEDPRMLATFNFLLSEAYKDCKTPFLMPKIILNEDILNTMNPKLSQAYKNVGAVGVDASILGRDSKVNAKALLPIVRDILDDKINLFIFPEGRLATKRKAPFQERFQPGVANIVNKILDKKGEINVIPLAFAYGIKECKNINCIQIGTSIRLKRENGVTTISKPDNERGIEALNGNKYNDCALDLDYILTDGGEPIPTKDIPKLLAKILCNNLEYNENIAKYKVSLPYSMDEVEVC